MPRITPSTQQKVAIAKYQKRLADNKINTLGSCTVNADTSSPGLGKTHATIAAIKANPCRTVVLQPAHENCREIASELQQHGLDAVPYPELNEDTCRQSPRAKRVQKMGLPIGPILCNGCRYRDECLYREQMKAASEAHVGVATQKRAEITDLMEGTYYHRRASSSAALTEDQQLPITLVVIDESPISLFSPTHSIEHREGSQKDIRQLRGIERLARLAAKGVDNYDRRFYRYMAHVAKCLRLAIIRPRTRTTFLKLPAKRHSQPEDFAETLHSLIEKHGITVTANSLRLLVASTTGKLRTLAIAVDSRHTKDGPIPVYTLVGIEKPPTFAGKTVIINDATADPRSLGRMLGRRVHDITPRTTLNRIQTTVQIPVDITRRQAASQSPATLKLLGWIIARVLDRTGAKRLGVITHPQLCDESTDGLCSAVMSELGPGYRSRIAKASYFGSGLTRGSNRWLECDALLILGTPRVPPSAIRLLLLQEGNRRAAVLTEEEAAWLGRRRRVDKLTEKKTTTSGWSGVDEEHRRVTVRAGSYAHRAWHRASQLITRAELIQSIGRGRGFLLEGIPTFVATTENLAPVGDEDGGQGLPIWAGWIPHGRPPSDERERAYATLFDENGNPSPKKSGAIAKLLGISRQKASDHMKRLKGEKRVRQKGDKGPWIPCGGPPTKM